MGFLRRLLGGPAREAAPDLPADAIDAEALEREHELEIAREEQARLDELQQRQLRYAEYAWEPPPQGGERRADDEEKARDPS
jgi:hypothetical protein